ncbi:magnesium-translocating P-type ATPase [Erysipelothrix sp. HDW6C]|uniref:magnesium-translocating P-type ATPase n=1 Tax=Erysipelothrix sp. HDW6C TaxID=2714930 RepID=UPI001F11134B|nr:magnesium-translocating P-type ATPase [Erysipelothrix sp. HDW6C]
MSRKKMRRINAKNSAIITDINARLTFAATSDEETIFKKFNTRNEGLSNRVIERNRTKYGDNVISKQKPKSLIQRLFGAFINPFTMILIFLAIVSGITDIYIPMRSGDEIDVLTVIIILSMVFISGILRFLQETRSGNAAEKLLEMVTTTATIRRQETGEIELPLDEIVVGDIVRLSAGDMLPADVRITKAKDLFVSQSALTGESEPFEKYSEPEKQEKKSATDYSNMGFMGSNVISGTAEAIVISTGDETMFGSMAQSISEEPVQTSFEKGVNSVSWVLIRFMLIMVPIVFFINGFTKGDWMGAFLFGISIAVGLTPEMLPMIVTTSLAKGAVAMSKEKTIIKNLNSIQNLGAIDVLCTDKTGTLTADKVVLQYHLDVKGKENVQVLRHAYLNSYFQTGLKNLMDFAVISRTEQESENDVSLNYLSTNYTKVDEIPFDFERRRMSVVVQDMSGKVQMITKGAVEEMLSISSHVQYGNTIEPVTEKVKQDILNTVNSLNDDGMRVIAVAQKTNPSPVGAFGVQDENEMVLLGYLAFLDPPKQSAAVAIQALLDHGVTTKILTGDNEKVTRWVCKQVGIEIDGLLLGENIEGLTDIELEREAKRCNVFAKVSPSQKARIIKALRDGGHTVGFMGDGINDAAAMKSSDVSVSVDTAVDIAKESADIILLEKDLMVLEKGIIEGRKTYANMIKYIKMTASSNFGNMFSVLAASAFLPFLPMMSVHLIFLNLIYDISCTAIPWDNVDEEFLMVPKKWDPTSVGNFMIWIGPTSSVFDWTTYLLMYFIICPQFVSGGVLYNNIAVNALVQSGPLAGMNMRLAYMAMFHAGWFVESMWSQTLVIHMIRTPKIPFIQSRASTPLTLMTFAGIIALTIIPFTGFGRMLGFVALPGVYFAYLALTILGYMILVTILKKFYIRRYGELL